MYCQAGSCSVELCCGSSLKNLDTQWNSPPSSDCVMMTWLEKCRMANPLKDLISWMECCPTYVSLKCYSLPPEIWIWASTSVTIWPEMSDSKDQNTGEITTWSAVCWWLCSNGPQCIPLLTGNRQQIIWSCQKLQSQQDTAPPLAYPRDLSSTALYHH